MTNNSISEVAQPEQTSIRERVKNWVTSLKLRNSGGQSMAVLDQLITPPVDLLPIPDVAQLRPAIEKTPGFADETVTEPPIQPPSPDTEYRSNLMAESYEIIDLTDNLQILDRVSSGTSVDSFWGRRKNTGETLYLKTETDQNKLKTEFLANSIYRLMGINVPHVDLVQYQGKLWTASTEIPNCKLCNMGKLSTDWETIAQGFVTDAYLGNLDVFGLISNANVAQNDHGYWRLDLGGCLDYRGRHGEKTFSANAVPEVDSMRDNQYTPGKVYELMPDSAIRLQVAVLTKTVTDDVIHKLVARSGIFKPDEAVRTLIGRREYLKQRFLNPTVGTEEKGEGEQQLDQLSSMKCFPQKTNELIQSYLDLYHQIQTQVEAFHTRLLDNSTHIQELLRSVQGAPVLDKYGYPSYYTSDSMELGEFSIELSDLYQAINTNHVPQELDCDEVIDCSSQVKTIYNQCAQILSSPHKFLVQPNVNKTLLRRRIEQENIRVNDEYMAHVTGYEPLLGIINNGHLMSKSRQIQVNGQFRATVTSKADQEMHQVVFDRRSIRPDYSAPEGVSKVPPVIFVSKSSIILENYQGLDSDGWHAFGKLHNAATSTVDDFDANLAQKSFAVLVPEEYRDRLYQDLQGDYANRIAIDERLRELNIVFIAKTLYRRLSGTLYSDGDMQQNQQLVRAIYDQARRVLPKHNHVRGRLMPNGNTGHGSATYNQPLNSFVLAN
ncbi:MAG: hypothetical protein ABIJ33_04325 [Patescibacteria group bacterium]|nr:hypothetical protein [Patescibacteria group bacterium]